MSSFVNSTELGGLGVIPGAYIITGKACENGAERPIAPDTRLKMQLIVKPKQTYFFRRIDSKCTYLQYVNIKNSGEGRSSIYFGKAMRVGNCYFKPNKLVKSPLSMSIVHTKVKGKNIEIQWRENPSLGDCQGQNVTWKFKRLKKYKRTSKRKLALNPLYGTL